MKRIGALKIGYDTLEELIGLVEDHQILRVVPVEDRREVLLWVQGPEMPEHPQGFDMIWINHPEGKRPLVRLQERIKRGE